MKDIIIIGSGGVGREVVWIINQINKEEHKYNIVGFIDDDKNKWGKSINGIKVLGGVDFLEKYNEEIDTCKNTYLVVAMANYKVKKFIIERLEDKFSFETIVHPSVYIDETIEIGDGTIIYPGVIMTTNIKVGNHVLISSKCGIGHDTVIKDYVSLLWNVSVSGFDTIEEGVLMGSGSTVIQSKTIGQGAVIGAGAVVIDYVPDNTTSVGIPARVLSKSAVV
ncbi:acetyltransferase [Clostridium tarantellae]|uniref:Transferase n=1 Tax=Clostridium tarantellae TaxID=39493 RepID=A0A6I1MMX0_9CLOT|nr:acetyltransferase [Clostridium tarantellae]MPQ42271.1 transferase [Clostridium tarantellae]